MSIGPKSGTRTGSAAAARLTWPERLSYALGNFYDQFGIGGLKNLSNPIYNLVFGMNPTLVGVLVAVSRLWDAFTDPVVGSWSDNLRGRWGRRAPFIIWGSLGAAITVPLALYAPRLFPGAWQFPATLVATLLFYTAFAAFTIPFKALGMELPRSYGERTQLLAIGVFIGTAANIGFGWVYKLIESGWLGTREDAVLFIGIGIGLGCMILGAIPAWAALRGRDRDSHRAEPKHVPFREALRASWAQSDLRRLLLLTTFMIVGLNMVNALGIYLNIYHVFAGDKLAGATLAGWQAMVYAIANLATALLLGGIANKVEKRTALQACLVAGFIGTLAKWWLYDPAHPWLTLIVHALLGSGIAGMWVLVYSMVADVSEFEELSSGREMAGFFAAIQMWVTKVGMALSVLVSGVLLDTSGFRVEYGAQQPSGAMLTLRLLFTFVPACSLLVSFWAVRGYRIDRKTLEEKRAEAKATARGTAANPAGTAERASSPGSSGDASAAGPSTS
jgi:glycoside/pentoside/hexuronide:cation symporter, GPH family